MADPETEAERLKELFEEGEVSREQLEILLEDLKDPSSDSSQSGTTTRVDSDGKRVDLKRAWERLEIRQFLRSTSTTERALGGLALLAGTLVMVILLTPITASELLYSLVAAAFFGLGVGWFLVLILGHVSAHTAPRDMGSSVVPGDHFLADLVTDHADRQRLKKRLADPASTVRRSEFESEDQIVKLASWLNRTLRSGELTEDQFETRMDQLAGLCSGSNRRAIEREAETALERHRNRKRGTRQQPDTTSGTVLTEKRKEKRKQRLRNGRLVSSSEIEGLAEARLRKEKGTRNCDIFRVVNEGPIAFVGAKVKKGLLSYEYIVLQMNVATGEILSQDTFTGDTGKHDAGKRSAQQKLDAIEGVQIDRPEPRSLDLEDIQAIDQLLFGAPQGSSGQSSGRRSSGSSRKSLGSRFIGATKKAGDIGGGDWFGSPQCPECGSQKVGQENDNAYQCRGCGNMIQTGIDVSFDE